MGQEKLPLGKWGTQEDRVQETVQKERCFGGGVKFEGKVVIGKNTMYTVLRYSVLDMILVSHH